MNQELIKYFENVLGIKTILRSDSVSTNISKPFIYIENFKSYSAGELELAGKILAAVGLTFDTVIVVEVEDVSALITFKDHPNSEAEIYSPRTLLLKPELKKIAWENLKNKMAQ